MNQRIARSSRIHRKFDEHEEQAPVDRVNPQGFPQVWQTLQQSIGNSAVAQLVGRSRAPLTTAKGDTDDEEDKKQESAPPEANNDGGAGAVAGVNAAAGSGAAGMVEDDITGVSATEIEGDIDELPTIEDQQPINKEDSRRDSGSASSRPAVYGRRAGGMPIESRLTVASYTQQSTQPRRPGGFKADFVSSGLTVGSKITQGSTFKEGDTFGEENAAYRIESPKVKVEGGKAVISGQVFLDIDWQVRSLGNTNISGPADPAVTAATWSEIMSDLTPDATGRPKRDKYWAKDLTERHEKFHASDDIDRATTYLPTANAWLNGQTVTDVNNKGVTNREVFALLDQVRQMVKSDGWDHYNHGGEDRAYADGKASYEQRVGQVGAVTANQGFA